MKWTRMAMRALAIALVAGTFGGCAPVMSAQPTAEPDYKSRAVTRTDGTLRVSTAVLSADESVAVYGLALAKQGIQPVWIEVENRDQ
ncbi:MAG TPA: hypothetical protein VNW90_04130 [Acetobacteraceae bacterium]|jgi:hypothetical protein|nr:hypothetical protein [Acetobacteraceae bacterium]